jgi:Flp pilus assembly protein TadB
VASQKSTKRKRRNSGAAPRAVPSQRREQRAERNVVTEREQRASQSILGTRGERPPSPFGGLPVSEFAIFAGIVALIVWFFVGGDAQLIVGSVVIVLGVLEVTAREHLSGYRSHTTLLAAIPAVAAGVVAVRVSGEKAGNAPLLFLAVPVFVLLFFPLRRRFQAARQARVVRPPAP